MKIVVEPTGCLGFCRGKASGAERPARGRDRQRRNVDMQRFGALMTA